MGKVILDFFRQLIEFVLKNKDKNENMYIGDAGVIYVYIKQEWIAFWSKLMLLVAI